MNANIVQIQKTLNSFNTYKDLNDEYLDVQFNDCNRTYRDVFKGIDNTIDRVSRDVKTQIVNYKKVERGAKDKPINKGKEAKKEKSVILPSKKDPETKRKRGRIKGQKKAAKAACAPTVTKSAHNASAILNDLSMSCVKYR
jgi:hypothetical protein